MKRVALIGLSLAWIVGVGYLAFIADDDSQHLTCAERASTSIK